MARLFLVVAFLLLGVLSASASYSYTPTPYTPTPEEPSPPTKDSKSKAPSPSEKDKPKTPSSSGEDKPKAPSPSGEDKSKAPSPSGKDKSKAPTPSKNGKPMTPSKDKPKTPAKAPSSSKTGLSKDHYADTCPDVEKIVQQVVAKKFKETFTTAPAVLRDAFHDCSNGCDASLLIASNSTKKSERDHPSNQSLAGDGIDTIVKAKEALEKTPGCKGKVSCADILMLAARDVVKLAGGPSFDIELGRFDSKVSDPSKVTLPGPHMSVSEQLPIYEAMGLDIADLTALSMAHSFGFIHCQTFSNRLYNFNGSGKQDPSLNSEFAKDLKRMCPKNVDPRVAIEFDPITPRKLDNVYYKNLQNGMALLKSDQALFEDSRSRPLVDDWAISVERTNAAFITAMIKMSRTKVLSKDEGEIRTHCDRFN